MVENIKPSKMFDLNDNGKIEQSELEKFGFDKNELAKLGIQIELENIKMETLDNVINKIIPQAYRGEILNMSKVEKQGYIFLFQLGQKILGNKTIEILADGDNPLPLGEVSTFLRELVEAEEDRNLLETSTIVLTLDEIKQLKQEIFTENYTKERLRLFVEEQMNENVSSSEIILGTKLADKIEQAGENSIKVVSSIDIIFSTTIEAYVGKQISKDTIHNMGTGFSVSFFKLFNNFKFEIPKNATLESIINMSSSTNMKKFVKITTDINKAIKELKLDKVTSENNDLLMNPNFLSDKIYEWVINNENYETIKAEIEANQQEKHSEYDKKEIINSLKDVFNTIGGEISVDDLKKQKKTIKGVNTIGETLKGVKEGISGVKEQAHNWVLQNRGMLIGLKETMEELGIWKLIKEIIEWVLKFLGFENGWEDVEGKDYTKYFENTMNYMKDKTNFENIKKESNSDKPSIFYKAFEDNLNENSKNKIENIKVSGYISQRSLYYLSFGVDKDNLNEGLDKLFENKNFIDEIVKKSGVDEDTFYKTVFKTEKQNIKGNNVNIGVINLTELSKFIEIAKQNEINNIINKIAREAGVIYSIPKKGLTFSKLDENTKKEIESSVEKDGKEIEALVERLFGISGFSYVRYLNGIGYVETRNRYNLVNSIGATGKYQFMPDTLKEYGVHNTTAFKNNPLLQEQVMARFTTKQLRRIAGKIKSRVHNDSDVAFFLAKAHLGGAGAVLKNRSDGNISQNKYGDKSTLVYNQTPDTLV